MGQNHTIPNQTVEWINKELTKVLNDLILQMYFILIKAKALKVLFFATPLMLLG